MAHYKPKTQRKEAVLPVRVTAAQHVAIKQAARRAKLTVSEWIRALALHATQAE